MEDKDYIVSGLLSGQDLKWFGDVGGCYAVRFNAGFNQNNNDWQLFDWNHQIIGVASMMITVDEGDKNATINSRYRTVTVNWDGKINPESSVLLHNLKNALRYCLLKQEKFMTPVPVKSRFKSKFIRKSDDDMFFVLKSRGMGYAFVRMDGTLVAMMEFAVNGALWVRRDSGLGIKADWGTTDRLDKPHQSIILYEQNIEEAFKDIFLALEGKFGLYRHAVKTR